MDGSPRQAAVDPEGGQPTAAPARPQPATIDLHTHTLRSDGLLRPAELARAAAAAGVRLLAITDHDTLAGYREVARTHGALPPGLELIPGVEINTIVRGYPSLAGSEIHVLGLGVHPADEAFEATLATQRQARRIRFERMVERLAEIGLDVREAVEGPGSADRAGPSDEDDALGRPTVARALVAIGAATSVEDAFERFLIWGRPGHVAREGLGPTEAIHAIRSAGGLPVLAHFRDALERIDVVRELAESGLGGIEVHHLSFEPATVAEVAEVAVRLGLVPTGGTDYHGDLGTYAEAHARLAIPGAVGEQVRAALGR
ncbi:MAG: PHP domain-containing protein [Chloroflexota bacterium]